MFEAEGVPHLMGERREAVRARSGAEGIVAGIEFRADHVGRRIQVDVADDIGTSARVGVAGPGIVGGRVADRRRTEEPHESVGRGRVGHLGKGHVDDRRDDLVEDEPHVRFDGLADRRRARVVAVIRSAGVEAVGQVRRAPLVGAVQRLDPIVAGRPRPHFGTCQQRRHDPLVVLLQSQHRLGRSVQVGRVGQQLAGLKPLRQGLDLAPTERA